MSAGDDNCSFLSWAICIFKKMEDFSRNRAIPSFWSGCSTNFKRTRTILANFETTNDYDCVGGEFEPENCRPLWMVTWSTRFASLYGSRPVHSRTKSSRFTKRRPLFAVKENVELLTDCRVYVRITLSDNGSCTLSPFTNLPFTDHFWPGFRIQFRRL